MTSAAPVRVGIGVTVPVAPAPVLAGWQPGPAGWLYWYDPAGVLVWAYDSRLGHYYPRQGATWGPRYVHHGKR